MSDKSMQMSDKSMQWAIITAGKSAVFAARIAADSQPGGNLNLHQARMVIQWGTTEGIGQLARTGPTQDSRLGSTVARVTVSGTVAIFWCDPEASAAWEAVL